MRMPVRLLQGLYLSYLGFGHFAALWGLPAKCCREVLMNGCPQATMLTGIKLAADGVTEPAVTPSAASLAPSSMVT